MAEIENHGFMRTIRKHLKYLREVDELGPDADLRSLGLNSFAAVNLLFDLEDTLGVALPDEYLVDKTFATPRALRDAFDAAAQH